MTDLSGLIERVEKASGPDREIDESVFELAHGRKRNRSTFEQYDPSERLPAYTSSLDAVVDLAKRLQPAWIVSLEINFPETVAYVRLAPGVEYIARQKTPALALLLAFLRAKQNATAPVNAQR